MSEVLTRARLGIYTLGVAAALAFGATHGFAKVPVCTDPKAISGCSTNANCSSTCDQLGYPDGGSCKNYCCYCLL